MFIVAYIGGFYFWAFFGIGSDRKTKTHFQPEKTHLIEKSTIFIYL